jgi:hypothetical protein
VQNIDTNGLTRAPNLSLAIERAAIQGQGFYRDLQILFGKPKVG